MKILYVDTTTPDLVVAVVEENNLLDFSLKDLGVKHSETLCNRIGVAMSETGLLWADFDAYACAIGPGSFTGIRIGISTLKGYNLAMPKPFIAVNCLEAISVSQNCGAHGSAVLDAGNGYYFADYKTGVAPSLVPYNDSRVEDAGRCRSGADYLDGAALLVRRSYFHKDFEDELNPLYIRRSQAEEKRG